MIAVDENICGIRLPALRGDIVCDVSTVSLVLAGLDADLYAGSQYAVSTNNLSQLSVTKRNVDMSDAPDQRLLEVLLNSWDRNNTILLNLLHHPTHPAARPPGRRAGGQADGGQPIRPGAVHTHPFCATCV